MMRTDGGAGLDMADRLEQPTFLEAGGVEFLRCSETTTDEVVFNENGSDIDFHGPKHLFIQGRTYSWLWCSTCALWIWHERDGADWVCLCGARKDAR
jgi:hypothetical protein